MPKPPASPASSAPARSRGRKAPKAERAEAPPPHNLEDLPGHLVRRLHQVAVALFAEEAESCGADLTPVQYAALATVADHPGLDQASLAGVIGYDRTTIGGVVERLEAKGFLRRVVSAEDRRVRQLSITPEGVALLEALATPVARVQERLMAPLAAEERATLQRLMAKLVHATNALSRTPTRPAPTRPAPARPASTRRR